MPVRVGFLGSGFIAQYHAAMLKRSKTPCDIVATYDTDGERAVSFAAVHGGVVATSVDDVLELCDAAYVCVWTSEHPVLVAAVAGAGRAVFVEKPLGVSLDAARSLCDAVDAAGVVNQVGLVLRWSATLALLRDLVQHPSSGAVQSVVFRDDQYLPTQGMYGSSWRGDAARAGAGTLLEHSIHDLDLLTWIVGPVADVSCRTAGFHGLPGIEDVAVATLAFASGAIGSLVSVWHDVLERGSLRRLEVLCERAWFAFDGNMDGSLDWTRRDPPDDGLGEMGSLQGPELVAEARRRQLRIGNPDGAFMAAVANGEPAWPSCADALSAHVLADACYRSATKGGAPVAIG